MVPASTGKDLNWHRRDGKRLHSALKAALEFPLPLPGAVRLARKPTRQAFFGETYFAQLFLTTHHVRCTSQSDQIGFQQG
jgi:hypothetical protein